jgi:radical SAM superfamily enzyme YgiQ (UPF0313 family)
MDNQKSFYIAFDSIDFPRPYSIVATRGCAFTCTFCYHTTGPKYRTRSVENIMGEIKWAVWKYKANHIFFLDELFSANKPRALEFCRQFREFAATVPWELRMFVNLRSDNTDEELVEALKSINCVVIGLGLESMSPVVLKSMKKHITPEQTKKCIELIASKHLGIQGSYIFGDPVETLETAKDTLDFFMNRQDIIRGGAGFGFIIPFPGTGVYKHCLEKGIIKDEVQFILDRAENGYNPMKPLNMTNLSDRDFEKLKDRVFTTEYLAPKYSIAMSEAVVNGIPEVTCKCPYCGRVVVLKNVDMSNKLRRGDAICRFADCRGRFRVVTPWYLLARTLVKIFGHQRLYDFKTRFWGYEAW